MDGISPDPAHGDCAPHATLPRDGELIPHNSHRAPWSRRAFMASLAVSASGCTTGIKGYVNNGFKVGTVRLWRRILLKNVQ